MTARNRLFVGETLLSIGLLTAAMYIYYLATAWGLSDRFTEGPFKDYVTGPGIQWELTITGVGLGVTLALINRLSELPRVRRWPFGGIILFKSTAFFLGLALLIGAVQLALRFFVFTPTEAAEATDTLSPRLLISIGAWILLSTLATNFLLEVRRKVGPENLGALFTGRYHRPRAESRVFLFVDLKGSTSIAETLGHERYSRFIQECFHDLSEAVLRYGARVYQFVGDEAVLTWPAEEQDSRVSCLQTYFAFQGRLDERRTWYEERFGISPEFRAGVEAGPVTVAEVGDIKREIAYHGDPLNTAARLLSLCKEYDQQMLVSEQFGLSLSEGSEFQTTWQDDVVLRGQTEPTAIYGVTASREVTS